MQGTLTSNRITLVDKEAYTVDLEFNEDFAILHLPSVSKFNKTVYLDFRRSLEEYQIFLTTCGYEYLWVAVRPEDTILEKLVTKLDFIFIAVSEGYSIFNKRIN